ncbi:MULTISPECIES: hypothetical protein [unclassified Polaribacter]|uniref:hypothetical protein n=1 Tax=unclassified Polaribacter TaxID=196858 RepID=UPI0011BE1DD6|nr:MULTISPECIES: hypothetical protein [unclassified Polaribacter]TXD50593.1 hypothetical protein ES043_15480 [Polaribacter sp. IC063]TXD61719.1 hypothetical protein ES044_04325 [Polaribacter sp. IC066]
MRLTQNHIEQLFKFTRKHYVYHYDVQSELVDHLANDIEDIWVEKPLLSFEEARDASFKKFGIFGFMDVIEAKQKQMNKRYSKILWRFFKEWFTVPKLVTTITIFLALFFILKIQYVEYVLLGALFILFVVDLIKQSKAKKLQKEKEVKKDKIFLLEAMIGDTRQGFSGLALINIFNSINFVKVPFSSLENHWLLLISFSATLLLILFYVTAYLIPEKAEELLQESYPEYKIVKNL